MNGPRPFPARPVPQLDPRPCLVCGHRRDDHLAWVRYDQEGKPNEAGPCHVCFPCFNDPRFNHREDA